MDTSSLSDSSEISETSLAADEFIIDEIVDERKEEGNQQYLIKWLYYPYDSLNWIAEDDLRNQIKTHQFTKLIEIYEQKYKKCRIDYGLINYDAYLYPARIINDEGTITNEVYNYWENRFLPIPSIEKPLIFKFNQIDMSKLFQICVVEHEFKTKTPSHEFYLASDAKLCLIHDSESDKPGIPLFSIQKKKTADANKKRKRNNLRHSKESNYERTVKYVFFTQIIIKTDLGVFNREDKSRIFDIIIRQYTRSLDSQPNKKFLLGSNANNDCFLKAINQYFIILIQKKVYESVREFIQSQSANNKSRIRKDLKELDITNSNILYKIKVEGTMYSKKMVISSSDKMNHLNLEPSLNWDRIEQCLSRVNYKYVKTKDIWFLFLIQNDNELGHLCLIKYDSQIQRIMFWDDEIISQELSYLGCGYKDAKNIITRAYKWQIFYYNKY